MYPLFLWVTRCVQTASSARYALRLRSCVSDHETPPRFRSSIQYRSCRYYRFPRVHVHICLHPAITCLDKMDSNCRPYCRLSDLGWKDLSSPCFLAEIPQSFRAYVCTYLNHTCCLAPASSEDAGPVCWIEARALIASVSTDQPRFRSRIFLRRC
ncbi:hypothetical protein F4804DRAFT_307181 [Jackrogersella minutella]|nr:hypothetical protein F4804DRAFT_307181 [Jackrogersella minutella]